MIDRYSNSLREMRVLVSGGQERPGARRLFFFVIALPLLPVVFACCLIWLRIGVTFVLLIEPLIRLARKESS